jgi:hypothetical protein
MRARTFPQQAEDARWRWQPIQSLVQRPTAARIASATRIPAYLYGRATTDDRWPGLQAPAGACSGSCDPNGTERHRDWLLVSHE